MVIERLVDSKVFHHIRQSDHGKSSQDTFYSLQRVLYLCTSCTSCASIPMSLSLALLQSFG